MSEKAKLAVKAPEVKRENSFPHRQKTNSSQSRNSHVDQILFLQRTIGNQAVQRLIKSGALQAKLRIGQPGDIYEQEADRVAEQVMQMPDVFSGKDSRIQRKCPKCLKGPTRLLEKDKKLQTEETLDKAHEVAPQIEANINALKGGGQPLPESTRAFFEPRFGHDFSQVRVHSDAAKLRIGQPGDIYEQEADRMSEQVMRMPDVSSGKDTSVQRKCPKCRKVLTGLLGKDKKDEKLQAKETAGKTPEVTPQTEANITALKDGGQPLPESTRAFFETRFGHDFSKVRVHSGAAAEQSAQEVNANAYTVGHDIVFDVGQYVPGTHAGRRLIAHELMHVIQQNHAHPPSLQRSVVSSAPAPPVHSAHPSVSTDPNCPGYESGERSASHREPGHLNPAVERLAPDKLLVADFGVDWRHVKSSTKSNPILKAWLAAWESNDSYRLTIVGYTDCVGEEGLNTDLRQARASNVETLLGPGARSLVTFRGMAALGNYVTDNNTPANRARNRSVVIEFHQEFTFPQEEIIATPQYCGPDSTQWLIDQMNKNRDHPVIKTQREVQWPNWIPIFNLGWNYGALSDFRDLVKAGAPWDFKSNQKQWRFGPGKTCPTAQCDSTVSLCGKCFYYDVPGNIHYGYIGRMASIRAWFLHNRASAAQVGGKDPADDAAAIDIGIAIADQGATLCGEIAAHESELNRDKTKGCGMCPKGS